MSVYREITLAIKFTKMLQVSIDGSETTSSLLLTPSLEDEARRLTCRAGLPGLPETSIQTSWTIRVNCEIYFD